MATPRPPEKALFFTGVLAESVALLPLAAQALEEAFGPMYLASVVHPFTNTDYYLTELGAAPVRIFFAWPDLYPSDKIAEAKLTTNRLEIELAARSGSALPRPINLDPGYLTLAKLVLASAKNYAHRIHLHDNIYAEVTLQYRGGAFRTLPWTFPDYASPAYYPFFLTLREKVADMR